MSDPSQRRWYVRAIPRPGNQRVSASGIDPPTWHPRRGTYGTREGGALDDGPQPVTNLGPDSGGRAPGEGSVRVYHWEWGPDDQRRPGLPWIGIFLLVFGALLLIQQVYPQARS